jgi:RNA polymerase sigma-54 factor
MYQTHQQTTKPQITAHLAQTMTLLTKSIAELNEEIEKELASNPALELSEEIHCPTCNRLIPKSGFCAFCTKPKTMSSDEMVVFVSPRTDFLNRSENEDDEKPDDQSAAMVEDLPVVILRQIASELAIKDRPIAAYLLNQLNEDGLLEINFEELASYFHVPLEEINRIRNLIQHADPLGVGSSSSQEALLIQLDYIAEQRSIPAGVYEIIQNGFTLLEHVNYREISKRLKISKDDINTAVSFIRENLNPFPARAYWGNEREPDSFDERNILHPDILINHLNNDSNNPLMVEIIMPVRGTLQLNPVFKDGIKQADANVRNDMKEDIEKASLFIKCLQQRNNTMQRLMERVISLQRKFVNSGDKYLVPLTRAQIARELQVHESTISRAVANKSIKLPNGEVVPLARFFERNLNVRAVIQEIIHHESKPLSDTQIAELLKFKGISIARRTVAKYRSIDGFLPAHLRKKAIKK